MGYTAPGEYTLSIGAYRTSPLDSTTYYVGNVYEVWSTVQGHYQIYIPKSGLITVAEILLWNSGGAGTAEDTPFSIRKNNTTDYSINPAVHFDASVVRVTNVALSIPVNAGDYIEVKIVTPAWVTNPILTYLQGNILIETP